MQYQFTLGRSRLSLSWDTAPQQAGRGHPRWSDIERRWLQIVSATFASKSGHLPRLDGSFGDRQ